MRSLLVFFIFVTFSCSANAQATENKLPPPFEGMAWLEDGARKLAAQDLELAPVTSCQKLNAMFARDDLTDLQKKREWKKYNNKLIPLTGVVVDVDDIPLSHDYLATFKCVNSESFAYDFSVRIPAHMEEYAYSLNNGERHTVAVRLRDYGGLSGIETDMDYFSVDARSEQFGGCKPTLSRISRKYSHIEYRCNDNDFTLQRFIFGDSESHFKHFEAVLSDEFVVIIIDKIPGEAIYAYINEESNLLKHYFSSGGLCSIVFDKEIVEETGEKILKPIGEKYITEKRSAKANIEAYKKALANNFSLDRTVTSCREDQAIRASFFWELISPYTDFND